MTEEQFLALGLVVLKVAPPGENAEHLSRLLLETALARADVDDEKLKDAKGDDDAK